MASNSPPAPPTGIDQLWDSVARARNPDGSVLISAETFGLLHVMIKDLRKVQTQLDGMANQLDRIDELARKVEALSTTRPTHELPKNPMTWANAARKNANANIASPEANHRLITPTLPPSTKEINEYKPSQVIIRSINPTKKPFEDKTTAEITDCVNFALHTLDIKPNEATDPITVRSAVRLPNGDIKLFTNTRIEAKCILDRRHEWSELANTDFVTSKQVYPVVLHSVPQQDMFEDTLVEDLIETNNLPSEAITSYRWLGNPASKQKSHGSMVVNFTDKSLAGKIARGGLFLHSLYLRGQAYKKTPLQCFRCLGAGHVAANCSLTVPPKCVNCDGAHETRVCESPRGPARCFNCINAAKIANDGKEVDFEAAAYNHHVTSTKCPMRAAAARPTHPQKGKVNVVSC